MRIHKHLQLVVVLLFFTGLQTQAQTLELSENYSKNKFITLSEEDPHSSSEFSVESGSALRLAIDDIYIAMDDHLLDSVRLRFVISLDHYKSDVYASSGGMGSNHTYAGKVSKTILSITAFPINFRVLKHLDINVGVEYGFLIHDSFSGTSNGWALGSPNYEENSEDVNINQEQYLGLRSRIAYNIPIIKGFEITPQVSLYRGFLNDFKSIDSDVKSYRYFIGLGVRKKL